MEEKVQQLIERQAKITGVDEKYNGKAAQEHD